MKPTAIINYQGKLYVLEGRDDQFPIDVYEELMKEIIVNKNE